LIRYLLDTDTLIYLMKKNHPFHQIVLQRLLSQPEGGISFSAISLAEIARGLENIKTQIASGVLQKAVESIIASLVVLEFNEEAAWAYGKVRTEVLKAGKDIGVMDALIAAHALSQGLILVTNNTRHFSNVSGLKLENWCPTDTGKK
jgi:tRNA(fMet)-specific endonuclease VapC